MSETDKPIAGGCLCGALRYTADKAPAYAGYCFCADCRKASGSGWVGFMGFDASALRFSGEARQFASKSASGGVATRNFCPACGSLVFGGIVGETDSHTIYVGSLDDPAAFHPTIAIFNRDRPDWAPLPTGLQVFETMPQGERP
jgi:hypothetical protein